MLLRPSPHHGNNRPGAGAWLIIGLAALVPLALASVASAPASRALELRGSTYFAKPPWKVVLVSYATTTSDPSAEYYFTISLSPEAGASLGRLTIQQTRGVDAQFPFSVERTRAFLGLPRHEGRRLPVEAAFNENERLFTIEFPEPLPPGETVTVMLKPWANPAAADTYMFHVTAWPSGPDPVASPVGFATLRIYEPFSR